MNLKKPISARGRPEWKYKLRAIKQFAAELSHIIPAERGCVLAAIPCSRSPSDAEYDPRLDDVLHEVTGLMPTVRVERPLVRTVSVQAAHAGGSRSVSAIQRTLGWAGFCKPTDHVILVDDVITTGSHFKACQQFLHEHQPGIDVVGVFWARTIWPDGT